jgi:hypothetical protein
MIYSYIVKMFTWFLGLYAEDRKEMHQSLDATMYSLNMLYQTPAVHRYLDEREARLKDMMTAVLLSGKIPDTKFMAGRISEIREMRDKLKAAHVYVTKRNAGNSASRDAASSV